MLKDTDFNSSDYGFLTRTAFSLSKFIPNWFIELVLYCTKFRIFGFVSTYEYEAINVIDRISPIPMLIIHSKVDIPIPYQQSVDLYNNAKEPKELWLKETGNHGQLYDDNPKEYEKRVFAFIGKHLNE